MMRKAGEGAMSSILAADLAAFGSSMASPTATLWWRRSAAACDRTMWVDSGIRLMKSQNVSCAVAACAANRRRLRQWRSA